MTNMVCADVCSQNVRKSCYKKQQRIKLFGWKLLNSMHATWALLKKKKVTALRYEITCHCFLKYFYIIVYDFYVRWNSTIQFGTCTTHIFLIVMKLTFVTFKFMFARDSHKRVKRMKTKPKLFTVCFVPAVPDTESAASVLQSLASNLEFEFELSS